MSRFLLQVDNKKKVIDNINLNGGFEFNPKSKYIVNEKIKKIIVYDKESLKRILYDRFKIKYTRLLKIIEDTVSSDSNNGDLYICLDETAKLKDILLHKYKKYLSKEKYNKFLEGINFSEELLNKRILEYEENKLYNVSIGGR